MESFTCSLCPRQCRVLRKPDEFSSGCCGMPAQPVIARAALHYGEEPCISGKNGSGTIFFSGCTLGCVFCQNAEISHGRFGKTVTVDRLADIFKELEQAGANNINLVSPTPYVPAIRKALELYKPSVPILYNTGGYERVETLRTLDGLVDVYLPDCKYIHADLAGALSGAPDYFAYAAAAIKEMAHQTGPVTLDKDGLIRRGTIVRHLVLPGHTKESLAVLDWLATIKEQVWVSLMFQYTPCGRLEGRKELQRRLTARECEKVWRYMEDLHITDGYIQDRSSSGTCMIPQFDLTGV